MRCIYWGLQKERSNQSLCGFPASVDPPGSNLKKGDSLNIFGQYQIKFQSKLNALLVSMVYRCD